MEAYLPPLAEYTCLLRVGTGLVSLAVQGEASDRLLKSWDAERQLRCSVSSFHFAHELILFSNNSSIGFKCGKKRLLDLCTGLSSGVGESSSKNNACLYCTAQVVFSRDPARR